MKRVVVHTFCGVPVSFYYDRSMGHPWGRGMVFCSIDNGAAVGAAHCSRKDIWSDEKGRKVAWGRALREYCSAEGWTWRKNAREMLWEAYFQAYPVRRKEHPRKVVWDSMPTEVPQDARRKTSWMAHLAMGAEKDAPTPSWTGFTPKAKQPTRKEYYVECDGRYYEVDRDWLEQVLQMELPCSW